MRHRDACLLALLLVCVPGIGLAQTPSPPGVPPFAIQSDDGDNRLQIGATAQVDGRFVDDQPEQPFVDGFVVRRMRSLLQGRIARYFDFFLNVDFAGGTVTVRDAWFDTRFSTALRVRFGKAKLPISYERVIAIPSLPFIERGFTTAIAPDRDLGVQVLGDLAGGRLSYSAAFTNGAVDGTSTDSDANSSKDLAGRVLVKPWADRPSHRLAGLGFGVAGSTGIQPAALPTFRTPAQVIWFAFSGTTGEGRRTRVSPQGFFYRGPFGAYGEFIRSHGPLRKGDAVADLGHQAWGVSGAWVITGEAATERNVRPRHNFDPAAHHWGAFQVVARYQTLAVDREVMTRGLAAAGSSRTADGFTVGANWYPNPYIKWMLDLERTVFDGDADGVRRPENALLLRGQVSF